MLEQAEISILGAEGLSKLPELNKETMDFQNLNVIKTLLQTLFKDNLPKDLVRFYNIMNDILKGFNIGIEELNRILTVETELNRGVETLNLSPYGIIIQSLINQSPELVEEKLKSNNKRIKGLLITPEMNLGTIKLAADSKAINIENFKFKTNI